MNTIQQDDQAKEEHNENTESKRDTATHLSEDSKDQ